MRHATTKPFDLIDTDKIRHLKCAAVGRFCGQAINYLNSMEKKLNQMNFAH